MTCPVNALAAEVTVLRSDLGWMAWIDAVMVRLSVMVISVCSLTAGVRKNCHDLIKQVSLWIECAR